MEEKRIAMFKHELGLMQNEGVRKLTEKCLLEVPAYFFEDCPSSSTSKYHPKDEHCGLGTVLHSKRVAYMVRELARAMDCMHCVDELTAAALLHDSVKYGWTKGRHTTSDHPELAASLFADTYKKDTSVLGRDSALCIYNAVLFHSGQWGKGKSEKPLESFLQYEMCMHLADVCVSRNEVFVNVAM